MTYQNVKIMKTLNQTTLQRFLNLDFDKVEFDCGLHLWVGDFVAVLVNEWIVTDEEGCDVYHVFSAEMNERLSAYEMNLIESEIDQERLEQREYELELAELNRNYNNR